MNKIHNNIINWMMRRLCKHMVHRLYVGGAASAQVKKVMDALDLNYKYIGHGMRLKMRLFMYRHVRGYVVHRLRAAGMTWTFINRVLRSIGQEQIVVVTHYANGDVFEFEQREKEQIVRVKDGLFPEVTSKEITPKIVDFKDKVVNPNKTAK